MWNLDHSKGWACRQNMHACPCVHTCVQVCTGDEGSDSSRTHECLQLTCFPSPSSGNTFTTWDRAPHFQPRALYYRVGNCLQGETLPAGAVQTLLLIRLQIKAESQSLCLSKASGYNFYLAWAPGFLGAGLFPDENDQQAQL